MNFIEISMGEFVALIVIAVVIAAVTIAAMRKSPKTDDSDTADNTEEEPSDTR
ncbi:MAG: hypothetical protein PHY29_07280 [Syntrophales bacterium]|nr:hypothetical protein [Syntrophales bacterium]